MQKKTGMEIAIWVEGLLVDREVFRLWIINRQNPFFPVEYWVFETFVDDTAILTPVSIQFINYCLQGADKEQYIFTLEYFWNLEHLWKKDK